MSKPWPDPRFRDLSANVLAGVPAEAFELALEFLASVHGEDL